MSNRLTKGTARFGKVAIDADGGLSFAGTDLTATVAEMNRAADLSVNLAANYTKVIAITGSNASTCEIDTAYDLPGQCVVRSVDVAIVTGASAGATLNVGLLSSESGGDTDGFLALIPSTSGARLTGGALVKASSSGWTSTTYGVLLEDFSAATAADPPGHAHPKTFYSDSVTAKSVAYSINSTGSGWSFKLVLNLTALTT